MSENMTSYSNSIQSIVTSPDLYQDGFEFAYVKPSGFFTLTEKPEFVEFETKFDQVKRLIAILRQVPLKDLKISLTGVTYRHFVDSPVRYDIYWMNEREENDKSNNNNAQKKKPRKQNPICNRLKFEIFGPVVVQKMVEIEIDGQNQWICANIDQEDIKMLTEPRKCQLCKKAMDPYNKIRLICCDCENKGIEMKKWKLKMPSFIRRSSAKLINLLKA